MREDLARELERVNRIRQELRDPLSSMALTRYALELEASLSSTHRVTSALDSLAQHNADRLVRH
jgi:hypothetical protein